MQVVKCCVLFVITRLHSQSTRWGTDVSVNIILRDWAVLVPSLVTNRTVRGAIFHTFWLWSTVIWNTRVNIFMLTWVWHRDCLYPNASLTLSVMYVAALVRSLDDALFEELISAVIAKIDGTRNDAKLYNYIQTIGIVGCVVADRSEMSSWEVFHVGRVRCTTRTCFFWATLYDCILLSFEQPNIALILLPLFVWLMQVSVLLPCCAHTQWHKHAFFCKLISFAHAFKCQEFSAQAVQCMWHLQNTFNTYLEGNMHLLAPKWRESAPKWHGLRPMDKEFCMLTAFACFQSCLSVRRCCAGDTPVCVSASICTALCRSSSDSAVTKVDDLRRKLWIFARTVCRCGVVRIKRLPAVDTLKSDMYRFLSN